MTNLSDFSNNSWRDRRKRKNNYKPRPTRPTTALPGSERKIRILALRYEAGEELFHPLDGIVEQDDWDVEGDNFRPPKLRDGHHKLWPYVCEYFFKPKKKKKKTEQ